MKQTELIKKEIERRREKCADIAADERNEEVAEYYRGKEVAYDEFLSFIESLEKEQDVDLEKEYESFVTSDTVYSKLMNGIVGKSIARHFYNLGLNAKDNAPTIKGWKKVSYNPDIAMIDDKKNLYLK